MLTLLGSHGDNAVYVAHHVRSLLQHRELAEAQAWLDKLQRMPEAAGTFAVAENKARLLAAGGRSAEAVTLLKEYITQKGARPANQETRTQLVAALLDELSRTFKAEQRYAEGAEAMYRECMANQPDMMLALAVYLSRQMRLPEALDLCDRAWDTCPAERVAGVSLAVLQAEGSGNEQYRRVERRVRAALARNPGATRLLSSLAYLQDMQGRDQEAEGTYRELIRQDKDNVVALNNLAYLLAFHGREAEGEELIQQAATIAGPTPAVLDTLAIIHLRRGDSGRAIKELEESVTEAPVATGYFHLAQAYHAAKHQPEARERWQRAVTAGLRRSDLHPLERAGYDDLLGMMGQK
jgi:predicted Zn-dependent protease